MICGIRIGTISQLNKKGIQMSKMHELLAVEEELVGRSNTILDETLHTFSAKAAEFYTGNVKTYKPFDADDRDLVPPVSKEIVDTVPSKLTYTFGKVADEYDFLLQKESTNRVAAADLAIDGKILLTDAPVNFLLTLERRLEKIRNVILAAPTLPNGPKWIPDEQRGPGFYKLESPEISYRTKQETIWPIVVSATKEHPAQTKEAKTTTTIGEYTEFKFDGRMTSHDKSVYLERVDTLIREVKKTIRRANQAEVVDRKVGKAVFDYVLNGNIAG